MNRLHARPRTLSLIVTHQCTAACDHCCFSCSPKVQKRIPPQRLAELIDEARAVPSIRSIAFTGGECFLLGKELDALIERAHRHGFVTTCTTNAYWAISPKAAASRIADCYRAGLDFMSISTGEMHAKYVPPERAVFAAVAAIEAGLRAELTIEEFKGSTFDVQSITRHPAIRRLREHPEFNLWRRSWIPNGAGIGERELSHRPGLSRFRRENISGCDVVLNIIAVKPDMTLSACCGYPIESMPDLHLGSVANETLVGVLRAAPDDFMKLWLHVAGPERMLRFVKRYVPEYRLPVEYAHACQTCMHLHRDPIAMRVLREHWPEVQKEITRKFVRMRRQAVGPRKSRLSRPAQST